MKPVIALVGRPNVGKSTLFNQITRSRDALVADQPGLTRDRKYGDGKVGDLPFIVIDTGGLSGDEEGIDSRMASQTLQAVLEADRVIFLVDGRAGLAATDVAIADQLRRLSKPVQVAVNKTDGVDAAMAMTEFYGLGLGEPMPIAAVHGRGIKRLIERTLDGLEAPQLPESDDEADEPDEEHRIRVAVVGRPNVGKSTLVNRILGEERVIAFDQPGTTRDSVFIDFERHGRPYTLIDTAGVRRRGKVHDRVEKFSVIKALQAIEASHVVIMLIDARDNLSEQDLNLLGYVLDSGRALVLAVNKWDGLDEDQRQAVKSELSRRLGFVDFAETHLISALHGSGVGKLLGAVERAFAAARRKLSTPELTRLLETAMETHQPPLVHGRRVKLRYAHQGGHNPPLIVIHGNQTERLPGAYQRYLMNYFRQALDLRGTPMRLEFKTGENPYAGKRNTLTPRQTYKRKRMLRHQRRGK